MGRGWGNEVVNPKILIVMQEGDICPKCASVIGADGMCWKCILERNQ